MSERGETQESSIPCPSGGRSPLSDGCNRRPFLSDGDCDRGEVDIHVFDDFPICGPINPTQPDIPPQLVETQWVLPTPPACTCIDIDYKFEFGGYKDDFKAEAEFKSVGDCCEGEYETKFNFDLPCPIGDFGQKKITVSAGWNCDNEDEQTYIEPCEDECCINPSDIDLKIGLPCPIDGDGECEISIKLGWDKDESQKLKYITSSNSQVCGEGEQDECKITPESPEFEIGLPCPIPDDLESKEITIKAGWNCDTSDSKPIIKKREDEECEIDVPDTTFQIGLPCPIDGDGESEISITLGWDKDESQKIKYLTSKNESGCGEGEQDDCKITPESPEFEIGLPCPIPNDIESKKIKIKAGWNCSTSDEKSIIKKSQEDDCKIDVPDTTFQIGLPCPIDGDGDSKIKINLGWDKDESQEKKFLSSKSNASCGEEDYGECTIKPESPEFDIGLPCPIPEDLGSTNVKIEIDWTDEKKDDEQPILEKTTDDCSFKVKDTTFSIGLPCPIPEDLGSTNVKIEIDWTDEKKDDEQPILEKTTDDCSFKVKDTTFSIGLPCPIPSSMEAKVKAEVKWGESSEKDEITILKKGDDDCVLEVPAEQETLSLALPCPIPEEPGSVEIQIAYGSDFEGGKYDIAHQSEDSEDSCKLEFDNPTFELRIPCPLDNLVLSGEVEESKESSSGESGDWNIEVLDDDESGDEDQSDDSGSDVIKECSKKLKIKLTVPEDKCTTVITEIHFDPGVMDIVYTTAEICGKFTMSEDSGEKNMGLPIAGHVNKCCGEKSDS